MNTILQRLHDLINARQHNRILRLSFPNNDGPACELVVNRLSAVEGLSRDFQFTLELLSDNGADPELLALLEKGLAGDDEMDIAWE